VSARGFKILSPEAATEALGLLARRHPGLATSLAARTPAPSAALRLGLQLLKENQPAEAAGVFRCVAGLAPDDAVMWLNYGLALDQTGADGAEFCFERSLELSPNQPDIWLLLGLARKKAGDLAGCEKAYRRALELEPQSAMFWQCLGLLKQDQHEYSAAIEAFITCASRGGNSAALQSNLGRLHYQTGRIAESFLAFEQAVKLEPGNAHYQRLWRRLKFMQSVVNGAAVENALAEWRKSVEKENGANAGEELTELLNASFGIFAGMGHLDAARRVGAKQRELRPDDPVIGYLTKALDGGQAITRSPAGYVTNYFDHFAGGFDQQLVGELGYDVPQKLGAMVKTAIQDSAPLDSLDAGCGTGLCGPWLRPVSRRLAGVDLSPKMLEQAARRGLYDELVCDELTAYLQKQNGNFDLILAADVIIYFGELKELMAAFARALRPGGRLAFSTESCAAGTFELRPSGRFAHAANYVRETMEPEFKEEQFLETTIRKEAQQPVAGNLFLFRRK
jgi:predicted TPR repeat methyltransferase